LCFEERAGGLEEEAASKEFVDFEETEKGREEVEETEVLRE
jgi:hypothetical protein